MCDTISAKMYSLEFVQVSKVLLKYFTQATLQFAIALFFLQDINKSNSPDIITLHLNDS